MHMRMTTEMLHFQNMVISPNFSVRQKGTVHLLDIIMVVVFLRACQNTAAMFQIHGTRLWLKPTPSEESPVLRSTS